MILSSMSKIVRVMANVVFGFTMVFGFYVVLHGHLTPGGGFQGGAVMASGIALLVIAYGIIEMDRYLKSINFSTVEALGLLGFIGIALLGLVSGLHVFFGNFLAGNEKWFIFSKVPPGGIPNPGNLNTGGVLPLMSLAVGMEVLAGISLIVISMASGFYLQRVMDEGKSKPQRSKKGVKE